MRLNHLFLLKRLSATLTFTAITNKNIQNTIKRSIVTHPDGISREIKKFLPNYFQLIPLVLTALTIRFCRKFHIISLVTGFIILCISTNTIRITAILIAFIFRSIGVAKPQMAGRM